MDIVGCLLIDTTESEGVGEFYVGVRHFCILHDITENDRLFNSEAQVNRGSCCSCAGRKGFSSD